MKITKISALLAALGSTLLVLSPAAQAEDKELNLYSARHYQTDEALYEGFTQQTGIKINRIEAKSDELMERMKNEGKNSPADVLIAVDASRLAKADQMGLFREFHSDVLDKRIPANLRTKTWSAFSIRARVIIYNPKLVKEGEVTRYEDLAKPELRGKVCTRSGSHPYNLSLGAALVQHDGAEATEKWAKGLVDNFARPPRGGDTDQIRAVAGGECGVAIANSYYFARLMNSQKPEDQKVVESVKFVWPNQDNWGTHINVSGAGIAKNAPHPEAAAKFLEYLASDDAQRYFANGNNEWPTVKSVKVNNPALEKLGSYKADDLSISKIAETVSEAQKIYDRAGYR